MNAKLGSYRKQQGAALFIALIVLIILALIGVTGMQATTQEEKMAGNMRDQILAFQAAESALRDGERWLAKPVLEEPAAIGECEAPACEPKSSVWVLNVLNEGKLWDINWWTTATDDTRTYTGTGLDEINTQPEYLVEFHSFIKDSLTTGVQNDESGRNAYRITARGTGGTDAAQSILQSTYTRRY